MVVVVTRMRLVRTHTAVHRKGWVLLYENYKLRINENNPLGEQVPY